MAKNELVTSFLTTAGFIVAMITSLVFVFSESDPFSSGNMLTSLIAIIGSLGYLVIFGLEYHETKDITSAFEKASPWTPILLGLFCYVVIVLDDKRGDGEVDPKTFKGWVQENGVPITVTLCALMLLSSGMEVVGVPHD